MYIIIISIIIILFILTLFSSINFDNKPLLQNRVETDNIFVWYRPVILKEENPEKLSILYMEFFNKITKKGNSNKRYFTIEKQFRFEAIELLGIMRERLIRLTPSKNIP